MTLASILPGCAMGQMTGHFRGKNGHSLIWFKRTFRFKTGTFIYLPFFEIFSFFCCTVCIFTYFNIWYHQPIGGVHRNSNVVVCFVSNIFTVFIHTAVQYWILVEGQGCGLYEEGHKGQFHSRLGSGFLCRVPNGNQFGNVNFVAVYEVRDFLKRKSLLYLPL